MALRISLKPKEKIVIGGAVVSCENTSCNLLIENKVPIMREKDIMSEAEANSPCRRVYLIIQLMYIDWKKRIIIGGILFIIISILITLLMNFFSKYSFICLDPELCAKADRPLIQIRP